MAKLGSDSLERANDAVQEVDRVLQLSIRGITQLSGSAPLVEALEKYKSLSDQDFSSTESESRIASAHEEAKFAQQELNRGFPVLHSHAVVALWGILEASIEDAVLEILESDPLALANPLLTSIKVPLVEFEQLDKTNRLRYLLAEYARNSKADLKLGVARFETLLELVRLAGSVEENVRRDLLEFQQLRNVIVHRAGRVDRRLLAHCPWLDLKVDAPIQVSHPQYVRYRDTLIAYYLELITRVFVRKGFTREQAEAKILGKN